MILRIPWQIWQLIMTYTKICSPDEITAIGTLRIVSSREVVVEEFIIPKQDVSPSISKFHDGELNRIICEAIQEGKDTALMTFRWHSHGTGPVYFSPMDEDDIEEWTGDWVVNLVVNAYGEHKARIDQFKPFRTTMEIKVVIDYPVDPALYEACRAIVDERVVRVPEKEGVAYGELCRLFRSGEHFQPE